MSSFEKKFKTTKFCACGENLKPNLKLSCKTAYYQIVNKHTIRKFLAFSPLDLDMITRFQVR